MSWLEKIISSDPYSSINPDFVMAIDKAMVVMKNGGLQVLYILYNDKDKGGMRYTVLEEFSKVPRSTLRQTLQRLTKFGIIKKTMKKDTTRRKEKAPYYMLTDKGYELCSGDFDIVIEFIVSWAETIKS
ncbi:MAG: winged helix-turn-helix transcriptional regulator [Candidatus Aenigmarchaeota archaeon]|nr:winged helix-turn-helix transcriptional regulator [Candidatus Aenigmarchaeota archaeon]